MKNIFKNIDEKETIDTAFQRFIDTKTANGLRPKTIKSYDSLTKDFRAYCEDNSIQTIDSINKQTLERYKTHLLSTQDNATTRNSYLTNTRCFLYFLMEDGEISTFKIKLFPEAARLEVSTYSDEELKKLLKKPKNNDFIDMRGHAMVAFLASTGVRRATLQHVLVKDVDFATNNIILRHVKRNNSYTTQQIPLPADLKQILRKYITTCKLDTLKVKERYLFPSCEGTKLHEDSINKLLNKYCKHKGVEFRGAHEFRRTYATKANKIIKDTRKLQRLMLIADERVLKRYVSEDYEAIHEIGTQLNLINSLTPSRQLLHKEAI